MDRNIPHGGGGEIFSPEGPQGLNSTEEDQRLPTSTQFQMTLWTSREGDEA